ncbi:hypothetical protein MKEN_00807400 [Mycena kentingensis (nom. inval.)]|nr:hypothetical protein MKEN_00807400 [Mycena kentingensis (nom. inval.)]
MIFNFRRKEVPWEVVDSKAIEPVPTYYEENKDLFLDLDIVSVGEADTCGTYVFQLEQQNAAELRSAVVFARQQLLREIGKRGFNALLSES